MNREHIIQALGSRLLTPNYFGSGLVLALMVSIGCSGGPKPILPPSIDADDSATRAMTAYDQDGDGMLSADELKQSPGLLAASKTFDADNDGFISHQEIVQRIESWQASKVGITSIECRVSMNGKPLAGATVEFIPEEFLGENLLASKGRTTQSGRVVMSIPKANRPTADMPSGVQFGLYKVQISKEVNGSESIPSKYNAETTLGQEISFDDPGVQTRIIYNLKG